jgi:hypothetical protein
MTATQKVDAARAATVGQSQVDPAENRQVYVRMYRGLPPRSEAARYKGLLGDCFLIRVVQGSRNVATILIDCGILLGSADASARMQLIAGDIIAEADGQLDLLVVTHEHWDHISGFSQAQDLLFDTVGDKKVVRAKKVWMAWTEDPQDRLANALRQKFDRINKAFAALADRMTNATSGDSDHAFAADPATALNGLYAFIGPALASTSEGLGASANARLSGREIMEQIKSGDGGSKRTKFLAPGTVLQAPGGLRAYVLGPPRDQEKLFKDKPTGGEQQETYLRSPEFENLLMSVAEGNLPDPGTSSPFSARHHRIRTDAVAIAAPTEEQMDTDSGVLAWLRQRYMSPCDETGCDLTRRRVDGDWLGAAGPLALKLDSDTNNTSLVLAFELPDGTILLFPGDAQVGNWLSWHDQTYDSGDVELKAKDLLARVRFYKVGHHGSHNATLDKEGLAMMTHPDLVAAIPTDEEFAKKQGSRGWQMPNPRVQKALLERTKGRIFRNDQGKPDLQSWLADPDTRGLPFPDEFADRLDDSNPLYLEYRVYG